MGYLRVIWKDMLWLNSLSPIVKIVAVVLAIVLIFGAWYLGVDWWTTEVSTAKVPRPHPRWESVLVVSGIFLVCYIVSVVDRYRKTL